MSAPSAASWTESAYRRSGRTRAALAMATGSCTATIAPSSARRPEMARLGESRMSSLLGLNAAPSTAMRLPDRSPPTARARQGDDPLAAAEVDVVHGGQQVHERVDALVRRGGAEGADVLGQAAAAEAEAGREELAADPLVDADRVCELDHVRAGGLAHLRHHVDKGDLGREERVSRDLHQLGGLKVHGQSGNAGGKRGRVHLRA